MGVIIISADVYFKRDLANMLTAAAQAGNETAVMAGEKSEMYLRGYRACISFMALMVGLAPGQIMPEQGQRFLPLIDQ